MFTHIDIICNNTIDVDFDSSSVKSQIAYGQQYDNIEQKVLFRT